MVKQEPVNRTEIRKYQKAQGCQLFHKLCKEWGRRAVFCNLGIRRKNQNVGEEVIEISSRG